MSFHGRRVPLAMLGLLFVWPLAAQAQDTCPCPPPSPPEPAWKGNVGAGLALTGGNSDTKNYNASFVLAYDPKRRNIFKSDGLYLRSDTAGAATVDKMSLGARDEFRLHKKMFAFGELRYLRDKFKNIDYLVSPLVGVGINVIDAEKAKLGLDLGLGGQFERDKGTPKTSDAALQGAQRLSVQLSPTATLLERGTALWKVNDFGDALYRFEIGVQASISKHTELKLGFTDDYKTRPPSKTLKKNDTALVAAVIFKIA